MVTDLATLEARVQAFVKDSGAADWTTAELDQAIRLALSEVSHLCPARAVGSIAATAAVYEYSVSTLTGLQTVVEVWYPYLSTDAVYKLTHAIPFRMIDDATLMISSDEEDDDGVAIVPAVGYYLRVFYEKEQTLAGLDSASATTLSGAEKSCLVLGAGGFAAVAKAQYLANRVTTGKDAADLVAKWGNDRLVEFRARAQALALGVSSVGLADEEDARVSGWTDEDLDI